VITLAKSDLRDFARVLILANTPLSLFKGIVRCAGMDKLRKSSTAELVEYYDYITARAERSEVAAGLAYAILSAIVLHARTEPHIYIDASRLRWGSRIWDFMRASNIGTDYVNAPFSTKQPEISVTNSPTARALLFGADGRPLIPGNR
jgi:hypothetical protein